MDGEKIYNLIILKYFKTIDRMIKQTIIYYIITPKLRK